MTWTHPLLMRRRNTIDIKTARSLYKGETEADMLAEMAKATGCRLIYKYANDFGDKVTHTDYVAVMAPEMPRKRD